MRALLSLLCLGLALLLVSEFYHGTGAASLAGRDREKSLANPPMTEPGPLRFPPLSTYREITERPLFFATRRPPEKPKHVRTIVTSNNLSMYELSGISISPSVRLAIVHNRTSRTFMRLTIGEDLAGWRVDAINPEKVVLSKDGETAELGLKRGQMPPGSSKGHAEETINDAGSLGKSETQNQARSGTKNGLQTTIDDKKPGTTDDKSSAASPIRLPAKESQGDGD